MKIIINAPALEFISNQKLLDCYSERTLLAIYELLQDESFGMNVLKLLIDKGLVMITIETEESWPDFEKNYIEVYLM